MHAPFGGTMPTGFLPLGQTTVGLGLASRPVHGQGA